ncbi:MAG: putative lipid II flippase FtsW [Elusimicrobia bacterium]|nr:putative lipid II flippase FtsW [Elusimicrobiota bacterium]
MSVKKPPQTATHLLLIVLGLCCMGVVLIYSASAVWAHQYFQDPMYFLKKQILWVGLGFPCLLLLSQVPYNRLQEWSHVLLAFTVLFLAAALLSRPVSGAHRWVQLGIFQFQPSEIAKLTWVIYLADYLDRHRSRILRNTRALGIPLVLLGALGGLILWEPDLGTPVLLLLVSLSLFFLTGVRLRPLALLCAGGAALAAYSVWSVPYRRMRLLRFLSPDSDSLGTGYQLHQALLAVGSGGWIGKGIGSSQLKLLYLPTPYTDFIFPIIAEELGLLGSLGILVLFALLVALGLRIAKNAPDLFGSLLASGITLNLTYQAVIHIAVTLGLLPTKGLSLPFFSYGGSSLISTLLSMGILMNIAKGRKVGSG